MPIYSNEWRGLDAGREGTWEEPLWTGFLRIVARHEGEDFYDSDAPIHAELEREFPEEKWRSTDPEGRFRPFIRDYPNAWTRTGTLRPRTQDPRIALTDAGRRVVSGEVTREETFVAAMSAYEENGENPYAIIAQAFLESASGELTLGDVFRGVMRRYRPGDSLATALVEGRRDVEVLPANRERRLRSILRLLEHAGGIQENGARSWQISSRVVLRQVADASPDGSTDETAEEKAERILEGSEGAFDPTNEADARRRVTQTIVARQGQRAFRRKLLRVYGGRCPISGCDIKDILDACHILKYRGPQTNHVVNGLPLRTDLHTLFDLGLIAINESDFTVIVHPSLFGTDYGGYHGQPLMLPEDASAWPDREALRIQRELSGL